ncbi:NAD-dependent epimerase/dehydratase family protein [Litoricolaceae bacterium]|nr:NAD-dependent epimerase/dehydratase family protein [Litorivicinaceae bacterium]
MSTNNETNLKGRRILVTGANGFIGQNLVLRLGEIDGVSVLPFLRSDDVATLPQLLSQVDAVVHLAGETRPADPAAFSLVNAGLTKILCDAIRNEYYVSGRHILLLLASSTQADQRNPYGRSKLTAEQIVEQLASDICNDAIVFRLPGVFGKWCKPNHNSVVATFCYNLARELPIEIHDPRAVLRLVYIDDVVSAFIKVLERPKIGFSFEQVEPEYSLTLGQLADQIRAFDACRISLMIEPVGTGLVRALYATYVSYFPTERFSYSIPENKDERGVFVEMLKTPDSGQFSFFTVNPGVTRGSHYHHTKTEKFLVLKGQCRLRFRHLISDETYEIVVSGDQPRVVDTIPGWVHDITNIGNAGAIVMLWANEVFDRNLPDCFPRDV